MDFSSGIGRYASRIRGIATFASGGSSWVDKIKMTVIGYARGHTFSAPGLLSGVGRRAFPEISVRPSLLRGLTLHLNPSDVSHLVVMDEILIEQVYSLSVVPFRPDVILDCGAHIGMFTLLAAATFPDARIDAFEPDPENLVWLRKQISVNHLAVNVMDAAVAASDGTARFKANLGCGGALVHDSVMRSASCTVVVRTMRLATFIAELKSERLLLKLDIEGEESKVLPDVLPFLPANCVLFIETHGGDNGWQTAADLMKQHGFAPVITRRRDVFIDGVGTRTVIASYP